jgi:DNA-binding SARP family transcriptional activator
MPMTLSISILGPLVIESNDCRLGNVPKKARALLAFLAAQRGQAVGRERLADLLWPHQKSERAYHSLRNCLLELRQALGPSAPRFMVTDHRDCRIRDVVTDLDRFERLANSPHPSELQAAADLYRGEFLAGADIDSDPFQEWLAAERDRTLALVSDILQRLIAALSAAGEYNAAIQSGYRLVVLDPLSELGQRSLIRALALAGRPSEALRQYKSCAETLEREFGVAPDAETQTLAEIILRSNRAGEERNYDLISRINDFPPRVLEAREPSYIGRIYRPDELVPHSGIYQVIHGRQHLAQHTVICTSGNPFPACNICGRGVRFILIEAAHFINRLQCFSLKPVDSAKAD